MKRTRSSVNRRHDIQAEHDRDALLFTALSLDSDGRFRPDEICDILNAAVSFARSMRRVTAGRKGIRR